ncbi:hypothetical protein LBMAG38_18050 [Chloroflexota bacterium]|nr:hypothetical protein LBMAG38_18050 [Chloroflexota bacterium]
MMRTCLTAGIRGSPTPEAYLGSVRTHASLSRCLEWRRLRLRHSHRRDMQNSARAMPGSPRHIRSIAREGTLALLPTDMLNQAGRIAIRESLTD